MVKKVKPYKPVNPIRVVTAASLFVGHDAAINIMRRILQASGAEVIHLGHDRSVNEIVHTAIQEDVQAIAVTSYQGGHMEFFQYMYDHRREKGAGQIHIFGGGGGTLLPEEIEALHKYGIDRLYSPDDGRNMGLQGMINDLLEKCDEPRGKNIDFSANSLRSDPFGQLPGLISAIENFPKEQKAWIGELREEAGTSAVPVLGITGTGGAGKSSLVDELVRRFLIDFPQKKLAILSVDPSRRRTGGALPGASSYSG